jgi:hypothetical protein
MNVNMASLDKFGFSINNVESLENKMTADFSTVERLGNHPLNVNRGRWSENYELEATFRLSNKKELDELKALLAAKKPVYLSFWDGRAARVVIKQAQLTSSQFELGGYPILQTAKLSLERDFK